MKIKSTCKIICATLCFAAGFAGWVAADTQGDKPVIGQGTNSCFGTYYALAKMTNSAGGFWLAPTGRVVSATYADASGFPAPYSSAVIVVRRSDGVTWCGTNGLTFPATNTTGYAFTAYVTSPLPPPTNGQPLNLRVTWNTN